MRYVKLLSIGIGISLLAGCVAEKNFKLCQTENEELNAKVVNLNSEMEKREKASLEILEIAFGEAKKAQVKLAKAEEGLAKIRQELSAIRKNRISDRMKMEKALKVAMSGSAEIANELKASMVRITELKAELAEALKNLKNAKSRSEKLSDENRNLKAKIADLPK